MTSGHYGPYTDSHGTLAEQEAREACWTKTIYRHAARLRSQRKQPAPEDQRKSWTPPVIDQAGWSAAIVEAI